MEEFLSYVGLEKLLPVLQVRLAIHYYMLYWDWLGRLQTVTVLSQIVTCPIWSGDDVQHK